MKKKDFHFTAPSKGLFCFTVNSSYTSRQGGVFSYVVTIFFYLPMPAQNFLILWHITIFAVHGFCGDIVFLCSYPTVGRGNFYFSPLRQKLLYTSRYFYLFMKRLNCHLSVSVSSMCTEFLPKWSDPRINFSAATLKQSCRYHRRRAAAALPAALPLPPPPLSCCHHRRRAAAAAALLPPPPR
jgi:hypothetical protein